MTGQLILARCSVEQIIGLYGPIESDTSVRDTLVSSKPYDGTLRTGNGLIFGVKIFPLFGESGEVTGVIRIASDITERFQLRQAAIETRRLAALGELAAGIAHEINNPNALVLLNTPIVKGLFADAAPILEAHVKQHGDPQLADMAWADIREEVPLLLEEMFNGGKRIQRIVEDLKNFVRPGMRKEFEIVDINQAVEASSHLLTNTLKSSTNCMEVDLADNLPCVRGDLQQIEQVVINLIQNACQALTDKKQSLSVSTRYDAGHDRCLIEVRDEGQGIAADDLTHILEPFFTTRRNGGGTGLGLSVSARIAADHEGRISFESEVGKGTCAVLELKPDKDV